MVSFNKNTKLAKRYLVLKNHDDKLFKYLQGELQENDDDVASIATMSLKDLMVGIYERASDIPDELDKIISSSQLFLVFELTGSYKKTFVFNAIQNVNTR